MDKEWFSLWVYYIVGKTYYPKNQVSLFEIRA